MNSNRRWMCSGAKTISWIPSYKICSASFYWRRITEISSCWLGKRPYANWICSPPSNIGKQLQYTHLSSCHANRATSSTITQATANIAGSHSFVTNNYSNPYGKWCNSRVGISIVKTAKKARRNTSGNADVEANGLSEKSHYSG